MQQTRTRKPINVTLDPKLIEVLDAWIEAQPLRIARSAVIEDAVTQYLEKQARKRT